MTDLPFATTLEVRDACLCMHVQRAARALARHFDEAFRPLESYQWPILAADVVEPAGAGGDGRGGAISGDGPHHLDGGAEAAAAAQADPDCRRSQGRARPAGPTHSSGKALLVRAVPIWRASHAAIEKDLGRPVAALKDELRHLARSR